MLSFRDARVKLGFSKESWRSQWSSRGLRMVGSTEPDKVWAQFWKRRRSATVAEWVAGRRKSGVWWGIGREEMGRVGIGIEREEMGRVRVGVDLKEEKEGRGRVKAAFISPSLREQARCAAGGGCSGAVEDEKLGV